MTQKEDLIKWLKLNVPLTLCPRAAALMSGLPLTEDIIAVYTLGKDVQKEEDKVTEIQWKVMVEALKDALEAKSSTHVSVTSNNVSQVLVVIVLSLLFLLELYRTFHV